MRKSFAVAVALAVLVVMAGPASAHKQEVPDADDTQGKLDIRKATTWDRGSGGDERIVFILKTYEGWRNRVLGGGRGNIIFNIKRSPESSYNIEIHRRPGGHGLRSILVMCIEAQGCDYDQAIQLPVHKKNRHVVKTRVHRTDLAGVGQTLRWRGTTAFGTGCDGNCFFDQAPDHGLRAHDL